MTTNPAREERGAAAALAEAAARLEGISDTPRLDAELLLAHALGIDRNALLPRLRDLSAPSGFDALVDRRAGHEPVAYIKGEQEFWDIRLMVTPDVLIPRGDSETLIEAARDLLERSIESRLAFLKFAKLHHISAQKRQGLGPVWKSIAQAHSAAMCKMSTPILTRLLLEAVQFQSPKRAGMFRPKLRYAHQGGMNPPVIVIHGNSLEHVTDAYKRFLEGRFRKAFALEGTPLRIEMKTASNPYVDKD